MIETPLADKWLFAGLVLSLLGVLSVFGWKVALVCTAVYCLINGGVLYMKRR